MKKILSLFIATLFIANLSFAQETAKKYRFGVKVAAQPTWLRSNAINKYTNSGSIFGFGFGLAIEYKFTDAVSFATGIGGDVLGGKQEYKTTYSTVGYAVNKNGDYVLNDKNWATNGDKFYSLESREISTTYVTIPLTLKMMTNEINGWKYFVIFGGNAGILTKARARENVSLYNKTNFSNPITSNQSNTDMKIYKDCIPVKADLNVGIGTEYRLAGTTSLALSINYIRGLTNLYYPTSKYLITEFPNSYNSSLSPPIGATQGAFGDAIQINIGILF